MRTSHDLGILLVHGIGEQPRGETMLAMGQPLIDALREWIRGRELGNVKVKAAELGAARIQQPQPAFAEIELELTDESGGVHTSSWLIAESWWAEEFHRPRFTKLAGWLLRIAPWAVLSHTARSFFYRRNPTPLHRAWDTVKVILSIPLGWLIQIMVVLVSLLALIPVPAWRKGVAALLLRLTGTLGDSYVLLDSSIQRAAAISVVKQSIASLALSCRNVVVIAHSQGAVIAHLALSEDRSVRVRRLITFGSGLAKLLDLAVADRGIRGRTVRSFLSISLLLFALLPRALQVAAGNRDQAVIMFVFMPVMLLILAFLTVREEALESVAAAPDLSLSPLPWDDFYAKSDPVPNGPIEPPLSPIKDLNSHAITNHVSYLKDHTTYWQNADEFVLPVLELVSGVAGISLFPSAGNELLEKAAQARRNRVRLEVALRMSALASVLLLAIAFRPYLSLYGREAVYVPLSGNPITKALIEIAAGVAGAIGWLFSSIAQRDPQALSQFGYGVLGVLPFLLFVTAWHRFCVVPLWEAWDSRAFRWLCRPSSVPQHPIDRKLLPVAVIAAGSTPLALSIGAMFEPNPGRVALGAVDMVIFAFLAMLVLAMLWGFGVWIAAVLRALFSSGKQDHPH